MKAVVLAAGRGTRLRPITDTLPKPLIEVAGTPVLLRILRGLIDAGVDEFFIVTGYLSHKIEEFFGNGSDLGVSIHYIQQQKPDGTASALDLCRGFIKDEPFFMTYGDILVSPNHYQRLKNGYDQNSCDALMTLNHVEDPSQGSAVYVEKVNDEDALRVQKIIEKPPEGTSETNWNSSGVFIFSDRVFECTGKLKPSSRGEYELTDALMMMIDGGMKVCALPLSGYWSDVGTHEELQRMNRFLREVK